MNDHVLTTRAPGMPGLEREGARMTEQRREATAWRESVWQQGGMTSVFLQRERERQQGIRI